MAVLLALKMTEVWSQKYFSYYQKGVSVQMAFQKSRSNKCPAIEEIFPLNSYGTLSIAFSSVISSCIHSISLHTLLSYSLYP